LQASISHDYIVNLSDDFHVDLKSLEREGIRIFFGGMSGSGKSNAAKVFLEELIRIGFASIVIDISGEYASLNEISNKVLVIGGKYADLPLDNSMFYELVEHVYKDGLILVFDLSEVRRKQKSLLAEEILETLYVSAPRYRKPIFLVVEECKHIAPQDGKADSSEIAIEIASEGRKFGIHQIWVTQRTAKINKNVLSECNMRFFGKSLIPNDIDRIKDTLKRVEIDYREIRELNQEFFLVLNDVGYKVKFRKAKMTDLADTPLFNSEVSLMSKRTEELASIIELLKENLEKRKNEKRKEIDKIKELEKERDSLKDELENLNRVLDDTKNELSRAKHDLELIGTIKVIQQDGPKVIVADSMKIKKLTLEIQQKDRYITELKNAVRNGEIKIRKLEEQLVERDNAIEELSNSLEDVSRFGKDREEILKHVRKINSILGIDEDIIDDNNEEIEKLKNEIKELKQHKSKPLEMVEFKKRIDFYKHPAVREAIANVKNGSPSKNLIEKIIMHLVEKESPVSYKEVQQAFGYKDKTSISKASVLLERAGLITRKKATNNEIIIDLNLNSLHDIELYNEKRRMLLGIKTDF